VSSEIGFGLGVGFGVGLGLGLGLGPGVGLGLGLGPAVVRCCGESRWARGPERTYRLASR